MHESSHEFLKGYPGNDSKGHSEGSLFFETAEFPEPPPNEMVRFWEDMQWMCEVPERFYGGFWGMPIHCIKQVIQTSEFNNYIGELEPWFGSSTRRSHFKTSFAASLESNPRNIGYGSVDERLKDEHPHIWDDFKDASWSSRD